MKVIERVFEKRLRKFVDKVEMQMGFMPGKGQVDLSFVTRKLMKSMKQQEKNCSWFLYILKMPLIIYVEK